MKIIDLIQGNNETINHWRIAYLETAANDDDLICWCVGPDYCPETLRGQICPNKPVQSNA